MLTVVDHSGSQFKKLRLIEERIGVELILALEAARQASVVTLVHCEDSALLAAAARRLEAEGRHSGEGSSMAASTCSRPIMHHGLAHRSWIPHFQSIGSAQE